MQLAGNEKRIQALFRELKFEDERVAPEFVRLWDRAQATSQRPRRTFKVSFALATALLVITLCSLALWSVTWRRGRQSNPDVAGGAAALGPTPAQPPTTPESKQLVRSVARDRIRSNRWPRNLAARRLAKVTARSVAISEAVASLSWQSPTATLMQSPADDVLTSLPQLNQSAAELKSFLPNTPQ